VVLEDGRFISGVTSVKVGRNDKVIIMYRGGGGAYCRGEVPLGFLQAWGITNVETVPTGSKGASEDSHEAGSGHEGAVVEDRNLQVVTQRLGDRFTLYARLTNCSEATVTLSLSLINMAASSELPLTVDAMGRDYFGLVTLRPIDPRKRWTYEWRYQWRLGRRGAVTSSSYAYVLPYVGESHRVVQGPYGSFSHQEGSGSENAIDWAMPVGSQVCAARDGTVVAIRQDSDVGGPDVKYVVCANYVVIAHEDGTFAEYCHLKKDGILVALGQKVKCNEPVGLSGNTGRSTAAHLHFAVFCTIDGSSRRTIPVQFVTKSGEVERLREGEMY
jgi:murein DD-endopeptidase MepM/ murein hydrolase activator NlpD